MKEPYAFVEPWTAVGEYASNLIEELHREVTERHPLWGRKVRPVAQRLDEDEVLFELEGEGPRFAVVHLTWSGEPEADSKWPDTRLYASFDHWTESMILDHKKLTRDVGKDNADGLS